MELLKFATDYIFVTHPDVAPTMFIVLGLMWIISVFLLKAYKINKQEESHIMLEEEKADAKALREERADYLASSDKMLDRIMDLTNKYSGHYVTRDEFESYKSEVRKIQDEIKEMKEKINV